MSQEDPRNNIELSNFTNIQARYSHLKMSKSAIGGWKSLLNMENTAFHLSFLVSVCRPIPE